MKKDVGRVETDEKLNDLEKRIAKIYSQASKEVLEKAENYLSKFADHDKEMREMVEQKQMTESEYKEWKRKTLMSNQRWLNLRDSLAKDMNNANKIARSVTQETMPEVYAINHNWSTYQAEKGALANTNYMLYDRSTVERLLQDDPDIMPLASKGVNSKKDTEWNKKVIDSVLLQGILQGESINNMSKRFEQVGVRNHETAVRYARTATTGAENAGRTDGYKRAQKMGIKIKKVWFATLDDRTRDSHRELDGETREVDEPFSNGCMHPGDPKGDAGEVWNCRCTLITKVNGADFNTGEIERASKLKDMTYDEWKQGHPKPEKEEEKPEKETELQKDDSDLTAEIYGEPEPIQHKIREIPDAPERPRRSNYENEDDYYAAREIYREEREKYDVKIKEYVQEDINRPRKYMTKESVMEWANSMNMRIDENVFEHVDMRIFDDVIAVQEEMHKRFPFIKEFQDQYYPYGMSWLDNENRDYVFEAGRGLNFGACWNNYENALEYSVLKQMGSHYLNKGDGTVKTTIRHEFGHNVDSYIREKFSTLELRGDDPEAKERFKQLEKYKSELFEITQKHCKSEYAFTNHYEAFAEGFAEHTSNPNSEYGKAFGEFLERWLNY